MGDIVSNNMSFQEKLESEFCPPLDSSLIAALVSEHISQNSQGEPTISDESMEQLRGTLMMLSLDATEDERLSDTPVDDSIDVQISSRSVSTVDGDSVFDHIGDTSSSSGSSMQSPHEPLASAFSFLQASFPHMPPSKISRILSQYINSSQDDEETFDMERIVEHLLSEEYVRELEERGLGFDESDSLDDAPESWQIVGKNMKKRLSEEVAPRAAPVVGKKKGKGVTFALTDVMQQNRVDRTSGRKKGGKYVSSGPETVDPWSQISSLATHLNTLLPDCPISFFQSYFHSPTYFCPSDALRAALQDIVKNNASSAEGNEDYGPACLVPILEILIPQNGELDRTESAQIVTDATLALSAAGGETGSVIDIVQLLKELDTEVSSAQYSRGVYHSPNVKKASSRAFPLTTSDDWTVLRPPNQPSPALSNSDPVPSSPLSLYSTIPPTSAWHTKPKRAHAPAKPAHAAFIPSYDPMNIPKRGKGRLKSAVGATSSTGRHSTRPISSVSFGVRFGECRVKRDEALREAGRYWQRGNAKTRGGEVAMFYAESARKWQEKSRTLALDDARARVQERRLTATTTDTIDLHYTTVSEAIAITKEVLAEGWVSMSRPLTIVTGRGSHSVNGVGVLAPAVRKALEAEGWNVGRWAAGLMVWGRTRMNG